MTDDNAQERIARTRTAARLARVGALAGALGIVAVVLTIAAFATGHTVAGVIAVIVAVALFAAAVVGVRQGGYMRRDPVVQDRAARIRRVKYRSAYRTDEAADSNSKATES